MIPAMDDAIPSDTMLPMSPAELPPIVQSRAFTQTRDRRNSQLQRRSSARPYAQSSQKLSSSWPNLDDFSTPGVCSAPSDSTPHSYNIVVVHTTWPLMWCHCRGTPFCCKSEIAGKEVIIRCPLSVSLCLLKSIFLICHPQLKSRLRRRTRWPQSRSGR